MPNAPDRAMPPPALPSTMDPRRRRLIAALQACATGAEHCAHAAIGLPEPPDNSREYIEACRDCATLCRAAAELLSRGSSFEGWVLPSALLAAEVCGRECELHVDAFFVDCARACQALRAAADAVADLGDHHASAPEPERRDEPRPRASEVRS